jgi:hypothetical protein
LQGEEKRMEEGLRNREDRELSQWMRLENPNGHSNLQYFLQFYRALVPMGARRDGPERRRIGGNIANIIRKTSRSLTAVIRKLLYSCRT